MCVVLLCQFYRKVSIPLTPNRVIYIVFLIELSWLYSTGPSVTIILEFDFQFGVKKKNSIICKVLEK